MCSQTLLFTRIETMEKTGLTSRQANLLRDQLNGKGKVSVGTLSPNLGSANNIKAFVTRKAKNPLSTWSMQGNTVSYNSKMNRTIRRNLTSKQANSLRRHLNGKGNVSVGSLSSNLGSANNIKRYVTRKAQNPRSMWSIEGNSVSYNSMNNTIPRSVAEFALRN